MARPPPRSLTRRPARFPVRLQLRRSLGGALAALLLLPAGAPPAAGGSGTGRVAAVRDGATLLLEDGREVRLAGIEAPRPPLPALGRPAQPFAEEARAALAGMVLGRTVALSPGEARPDRHGRRPAHLHLLDAAGARTAWVQGELLRRGLARVGAAPDEAAPAMLALERAARAERRGLWGDAFYAVLKPWETWRHRDSFQLVEGQVLRAAAVKGRIFLDFGPDWRSDFTVAVPREAVRPLRRAGLDPLRLEGRRLRVRGWLTLRNGPMIEAAHAGQIELLDP